MFPKTQTRRRGAILPDLQRHSVKPCNNTETHFLPHMQINSSVILVTGYYTVSEILTIEPGAECEF